MPTLYGSQGSGAAAIEAALQIAKLEFRWVDVAKAPAKLKRANPLAQVPTLVLDDGTVMTESAAILIFLGLKFPRSRLLPAKPAQAIRGLVFIAANCYAAIGIIDFPKRFCERCDQATAERIRAGTRARLHRYWETFADEFVFLKDGRIGALELLAAVVSRWSGARRHLEAKRPRFYAKLQKVEADPRIADVFRRHWP